MSGNKTDRAERGKRTAGKKGAAATGWNGQLAVATFLAMGGMALLFAGFWCAPKGEIHQSVLIGFGEVSTFAGALFGVDYSYKFRYGRKGE